MEVAQVSSPPYLITNLKDVRNTRRLAFAARAHPPGVDDLVGDDGERRSVEAVVAQIEDQRLAVVVLGKGRHELADLRAVVVSDAPLR